MPQSKLVGLMFEAWVDIDRVVEGLTPEEAVRNWGGGSAFAWTLAHVTHQLDGWINVRFQKHPPHPLINDSRFAIGGTGEAEDWEEIVIGVAEVRRDVRSYLDGMKEDDLDLVIPYDGTFSKVREKGLSLRHALIRLSAHHYYHIGEIGTKRDSLGHKVGDYPGELSQAI